ncbi:MAG: amidase family protein [Owenweeksia sp.]|nr:amidase family protein [Owenweeksia sp.]
MKFDTLREVQENLQNETFTCASMIEDYLARIEKNQNLNLFVEVFAHDARSRATVIDHKLKRGTAGKLAGLVLGIKDNLCYRGHKVTAASKILDGFESLFDATVVQRLLEEDAIIIGRLNCDEFAMGSSNEFSVTDPSKNPLNKKKVPEAAPVPVPLPWQPACARLPWVVTPEVAYASRPAFVE